MSAIRKLLHPAYVFLTWLGILQLVAMILIVSVNVFYRYVMGRTFGWVDEVAILLVVWFSMIALALGVKMKLHIAIELFTNGLPAHFREQVLSRLSYGVTLVFGLVLFFYGIQLAKNGMSSTLPATGLPSTVEYIFVPVSGFFIALESLLDLADGGKGEHFENEFLGGGTNA
ncbi:TRAP transporter small permease [Anaerotalea alkaliphila]|uniref:TRAP transporter small permease n=1 Tax=Anaerotalea alkaliphila TaxID=2662126 RepID=A0A7X5HYA8_9FIRM|nr:TRAP transporter small permease [Anaerotalea alkaliphila]NDL68858.1 TRAP transporter small permease [Anaerotalea alkaliphila]